MELNKIQIENQIHSNYEFFKRKLPKLIETHEDQFAVIRNQEIIEYFDDFEKAFWFSLEKYPDHLFSIQKVTNKVAKFRNVGVKVS